MDQPRLVNLHFVWDTSILLYQKGRTPILKFALALNRKITPEEAKQWSKGAAEQWANESHQVAVKVAYAGVPANGSPPKLDEGYVDRAENAVDEQLEKGGVRLATVLNRCFAGKQDE